MVGIAPMADGEAWENFTYEASIEIVTVLEEDWNVDPVE